MQALLRQSDTLARYGGEEFAVLLPDTDLGKATEVAQRICQTVSAVGLPVLRSDRQMTVSIGVADNRQGGEWQLVLERADQALYVAKQEGRNRVRVSPVPQT